MRCVAEGIIPCGHCASCRRGATNVCETYDEVGFTREGAAGDQVAVPARVVHVLDDDRAAARCRARRARGGRAHRAREGAPAPRPAHARRRRRDDRAARRAPCAALVAGRARRRRPPPRAGGARTCARRDRRSRRRAADAASTWRSRRPARPAATEAAIGSLRRGGTALLLGIPPSGSTLTLPGRHARQQRPLDSSRSFGYTSAAWTRVVALLNAGSFRPGRLVTHRSRSPTSSGRSRSSPSRAARAARCCWRSPVAEIGLVGLEKTYPDGTRAVEPLDLEIHDGEFVVSSGRPAAARRASLRMVAGLEEISRRRDPDRRPGREPPPAEGARHRDGVPELRALPAHGRLRQHGVRAPPAAPAEGGDRAARAAGPRERWGSRRRCARSRARCRAASASASRWAARSCASRRRS